jgi:tetratricopeptide (TPR) repeat protein
MICPLILKQTRKSEGGLEEWEHQPCLEESCSLFYEKKKKCSLFHNSESTNEMRNILERTDFVSSFQVLKSSLDTLQKALSEEIKIQQQNMGEKQEAIQGQINTLSQELSGEVLDNFSEKIEGVQKVFESFSERLDQSMQGVVDRLSTLDQKVSSQVQEWDRRIEEVKSALQDSMERIGQDVQKGLQQGAELSEKVSSEHEEGARKMEALLGESHRLMADLLNGNREIQTYYAEQRKHVEEDALRRKKESSREENNRGVVYFYRSAYEAAALAFEKAVEYDPEYAEAYNNLGLVYTELERSDHAVQAFEKALSLRPDLGEVYNNLGLLSYEGLDYAKATEMFSKALEDGCKDRAMAYTNFGNSLYQLKRYEEAAGAWNKALQINPLHQNAKKGLALLKHQKQGVI